MAQSRPTSQIGTQIEFSLCVIVTAWLKLTRRTSPVVPRCWSYIPMCTQESKTAVHELQRFQNLVFKQCILNSPFHTPTRSPHDRHRTGASTWQCQCQFSNAGSKNQRANIIQSWFVCPNSPTRCSQLYRSWHVCLMWSIGGGGGGGTFWHVWYLISHVIAITSRQLYKLTEVNKLADRALFWLN